MKVSGFESLSVLVMRTYTTSLPEKQQFMTFPLTLFSLFCLFEPLQKEIVLLTCSLCLSYQLFFQIDFCSFPDPYSDFLGVASRRLIWIVFCVWRRLGIKHGRVRLSAPPDVHDNYDFSCAFVFTTPRARPVWIKKQRRHGTEHACSCPCSCLCVCACPHICVNKFLDLIKVSVL